MADAPEPIEEMSIPEDLEEIKGELTAIFHGQSQRVTEFRVVVAQGLRKTQEELHSLLERGKELVRRNSEILMDAGDAQAASDRFDKLQGEIDGRLNELKRVNDELGDECDSLRSEQDEQSRARKETSEENEEIREEIHKLTTEIDRLEIDNDVVRKELKSLERKKEILQKDVDILQGKRQEFLSEIAKYKEVKSGLVG